ncbi:VanZ family protein [Microbacterium sp. P03]|uniref:VanZ family protein n=1 Tax=Microbacterium sp. P03 TaxID=3366946 RepID=UPI003745572C
MLVLSRRRVAAGRAHRWALRSAAAEVGLVVGTAPWIWLILTPTGAPSSVRLAPFRDLAGVLEGGDAVVQLVGNLLVFAAFGFCLPVRFRIAAPAGVVPAIALMAAASSTVLELLQLGLNLGRVTSVDDVLLNALGAALASLLSYKWWRTRIGPHENGA